MSFFPLKHFSLKTTDVAYLRDAPHSLEPAHTQAQLRSTDCQESDGILRFR